MAHPDASGIENEIKAKIHVAKKGGGYICHSDHPVPDSISPKQYCQVIEWARKHGAH